MEHRDKMNRRTTGAISRIELQTKSTLQNKSSHRICWSTEYTKNDQQSDLTRTTSLYLPRLCNNDLVLVHEYENHTVSQMETIVDVCTIDRQCVHVV